MSILFFQSLTFGIDVRKVRKTFAMQPFAPSVQNKYITKTEILSFAGAGLFCLCDDYRCDIKVGPHMYPSVRHAVLSLKTKDVSIQAQIRETMLAADLKTLERRIEPMPFWDTSFVIRALEDFTLVKFQQYPEYNAVLKATRPKVLINGLIDGQRRFDIDEVNNESNIYGTILMKIREM